MEEVEFCGHILREGRRSPAPGKLLPIQKWEIAHSVTALRGFLGLKIITPSMFQGMQKRQVPHGKIKASLRVREERVNICP